AGRRQWAAVTAGSLRSVRIRLPQSTPRSKEHRPILPRRLRPLPSRRTAAAFVAPLDATPAIGGLASLRDAAATGRLGHALAGTTGGALAGSAHRFAYLPALPGRGSAARLRMRGGLAGAALARNRLGRDRHG